MRSWQLVKFTCKIVPKIVCTSALLYLIGYLHDDAIWLQAPETFWSHANLSYCYFSPLGINKPDCGSGSQMTNDAIVKVAYRNGFKIREVFLYFSRRKLVSPDSNAMVRAAAIKPKNVSGPVACVPQIITHGVRYARSLNYCWHTIKSWHSSDE